MLQRLSTDGFIELASPKDSVGGLTVAQLKDVLKNNGQSTTGKKAELVARAAETLTDDVLLEAGVQQKYMHTKLGRAELEKMNMCHTCTRIPRRQ